METAVSKIVEATRGVVGSGPFGLHEPDIGALEEGYVLDCLRSGYVSSVGEHVGGFEDELANLVGSSYSIAVVSGTAALHLGLLALGVKESDEVIVPSLTFVATVNAIAYCGATPHFVDVEDEVFGVSPEKLDDYLASICDYDGSTCTNRNTGNQISALVVVHLLGFPARIKELCLIAKKYGLRVLEDAAGAIGSRVNGQHVGTFGDIGILSFNGNKTITTGGGGAVLTSDEEFARTIRDLATTWRIPHPFEVKHGGMAFNYRMPNINAALGLAQLARLDEFLDKQSRLHSEYQGAFSGIAEITMVEGLIDSLPNNWLQGVLLGEVEKNFMDALMNELARFGLQARLAWSPIHKMKAYESSPRADLSVTERVAQTLICLPSSPQLVG